MVDPYEWSEVWSTPHGPLEVGGIREGDEHELLRFFRERLGERSNFYLALHLEHTDEEALEAMRQRIAGHVARTGLVYVARLDGQLVGYFFLANFAPVGENTPSLGIGLADSLHGLGIASRFMDRLITAATEAGHTAITLIHHPENQPAARLYQRKGFRYTGETSQRMMRDGSERVELCMRWEAG